VAIFCATIYDLYMTIAIIYQLLQSDLLQERGRNYVCNRSEGVIYYFHNYKMTMTTMTACAIVI